MNLSKHASYTYSMSMRTSLPHQTALSYKLFFLHKVTQGERSKLSSTFHAYCYVKFHSKLVVDKLFQSVPIDYHCSILNVIRSIFDDLDSYMWEIWGSCGCSRLMDFAGLLLHSHKLHFLMFCEFSSQSCNLLLPPPGREGAGGEGREGEISSVLYQIPSRKQIGETTR